MMRNKGKMTKAQMQRELASQEERIIVLELALTKIRDQLLDVQGKWPMVQELLKQLTTSGKRQLISHKQLSGW